MADETAVTWGKNCDVTVHEREPFNAESAPAALAQTQLTSTAEFYVRNHGPVPELDSHTWRLAVDGLVEHPLELSLQQLQCEFTHARSWPPCSAPGTVVLGCGRSVMSQDIRGVRVRHPPRPGPVCA